MSDVFSDISGDEEDISVFQQPDNNSRLLEISDNLPFIQSGIYKQ